MADKTICPLCEKRLFTMLVKVCKGCGKTSDADSATLRYCTDCAKKLGVCRGCGKDLKTK